MQKVDPSSTTGCIRIPFRAAEVRAEDGGQLWQQLRLDPMRHLRALEEACKDQARTQRPGAVEKNQLRVSLTGPIGASANSPRQLTSASLRQLVCIEGVATKVSTIKPKVVKSVHYNAEKQSLTHRTHVDATDANLGLKDLDANGKELADRIIKITTGVYPTADAEGNQLETEFGLSQYKDHQTITLQEMPEKAPMGQLPRSTQLVIEHDLVDKIKPGDRVMVVGIYRALAPAGQGQQTSSGIFRTTVLVNSIQILGRDASALNIQSNDITQIRALSKRTDILSILGRSFCPSIHGHKVIKKALALQLLSGVEKNLKNGTHLRGDINILMVGDPSTAKSQLLRAAMNIAQLAVSTTGKGSSGVGLTAAVTTDPETGERRLEAGAMVLADRGLVCVDEFDKMGEGDRVAIHEAMEQQTVTIAKAGIHASLNARCSVLAAANPVYGQYDRRRRVQENIGLPDSLLSRFDLLFVVLDQMDPETDRKIAAHVVKGHRYRSGQGQSGHDSDYDEEEDEEDDEDLLGHQTHSIWQRNRKEDEEDVLQHDFLRKYLYFCKNRVQPCLSDAAREFIASRYADLRARQDERTLPITPRSLETIIRMATAHAKARLRTTVVEEDCAVAMEILGFALYHENITLDGQAPPTAEEQSRKRARFNSPDEQLENSASNVSVSSQEETNTTATTTTDGPDPLDAAKKHIWETLQAQGDVAEVEGLLAMGEKEVTAAALTALVADGRVQVSDGHAFVV
jgi:DNA replication licensing factor MCM3